MFLYSKVGYHSTVNKGMTKFEDTTDDTKAKTGEGAMIHGWGLYLQSDKQLNIDRYKKGLGGFIPYVTLIDKDDKETEYHGTETQYGIYDGNTYSDSNGNIVEPPLQRYLDDIFMGSYESVTGKIRDCEYWIEIIKNGTRLNKLIEIEYQARKEKLSEDLQKSSDYYDRFEMETYGTNENSEIPDDRDTKFNKWLEWLKVNVYPMSEKDIQSLKDELDKELIRYENSLKFYQRYQYYYDNYQYRIDSEHLPVSQYEVEIPDGFVFLEEDDNVDLNNKTIHDICRQFNLIPENLEKDKENLLNRLSTKYPDVEYMENIVDTLMVEGRYNATMEYHNYNNGNDFEIEQIIYDIVSSDYYNDMKYSVGKNYELYRSLSSELHGEKNASEYLYKHGINGIHYYGEEDGECWVIFNCSKLKIVKEE